MIVEGKHYLKAALYVILRRDMGEVLFLRRAGTGYMDGMLGLPSGHVEQGESFLQCALRELKEEIGVVATEDKTKQIVTLHRYQNSGEHDYVDNFFEIRDWMGDPVNSEPEKCSELVWAKPEEIEPEIVPYLTTVFKSINEGTAFVEFLRGDDE
jgi:8-oxo-dGTP pyrophosphatase MutT (NUDIX family)